MYINGFHHVRYRSPLNSELPGDDGSGGQSKKPSDDLLKALFESIFNETTSGSQDPAPNIYHAQQNLKHINTVLDIGKYLPPEETRREMTTMGFSSKQIDYVLAKSRTPDVSVDKVMDQFDKIFELHETNDQENLCDDLLAALFSQQFPV